MPVSELGPGSYPFTDRVYEFDSIGSFPDTCCFIQAPNNDKDTPPDSVQWTLDVPFDSTVYLDFWGQQNHLDKVSAWSGSWTVDHDVVATIFDRGIWGPGIIIKQNFDAGTINLMGNNGDGHGTYYAFVCPQGKKSHTL